MQIINIKKNDNVISKIKDTISNMLDKKIKDAVEFTDENKDYYYFEYRSLEGIDIGWNIKNKVRVNKFTGETYFKTWRTKWTKVESRKFNFEEKVVV